MEMTTISRFADFLYESFDVKQADLKDDFDMLNDKMFGGKLARPHLRLMATKYKLGVMAYTKEGKIEYVGISSLYDITRQQYLDILAHEMIHVWMEQTGQDEKDHHGRKFMAKLEELNARFPEFKIRKSENAADYNVSGAVKVKEYGVVLFDEDGEWSIVVVNPAVIDDEKALDEFVAGIKKYGSHKFKKLTMQFYKSSNPDLPKFKIKKNLSLRSLELYVLDPKLAGEIRKETPVREDVIK